MGRDGGFTDEANSSNESLEENVVLPVSKVHQLITKRKIQILTFCWLQPSYFDLFLPYFWFSLLTLIFLFTQCYYISTWNEVFHIIEVLKYLKLILTAPATNAMSERLCSTLRRIKIYLRSSMTQELLRTSCYL